MTGNARPLPANPAPVVALLLVACAASMLPSHVAAQLPGGLVVTLTSPPAGARLRGPVTVNADVSIIGALTVRGVQFKLDGANLGAEDTTAPYSVPWNTLTASNGSHTLTAVARDLLGVRYTSNAVAMTVDNLPPAIAITAPAANATIAGTATVSATASDSSGVAGVQFKVDGIDFGAEDTTAPYSVIWNTTAATNGPHVLTAVARDTIGNTGAAAGVTVIVDNAPPVIAVTNPASGAIVRGIQTVTADATASSGIAGVQFKLDGVNLGAEDTAAPYAAVWDTTAASNESHTLTAVARDTVGNVATAAAIVVTVSNSAETTVRVQDTSASITYAGSWALGSTVRAFSGGTAALATGGPSATGDPTRATLTFTGTAVRWIGFQGPQTGIARVFLDGTLVATVDTYTSAEVLEPVLYTASGLTAASHTLAIESTGTKNPASSDIFVIVDAFDVTSSGGPDTTPPAVAMTAPGAGAPVSGTITVSASASDGGGVGGVQFLLDGALLQAEDTTAPYSINWDTRSAADGSHVLTAVARDAAGNTATAAAISVTVSNTAPPPASVMTRFENTHPAIVYTPGSAAAAPPNWWHGSRSRGWSAETASFNRSEGARATFTFTGTSVTWLGFRATWAGIGHVYLDGAFAGEIDLYAATEQAQSAVFTAAGLAAGTHTLIVESTGRKNPSATDNAVVVDAFDVGPAAPPTIQGTRIEDTASSITYTAGWTAANMSTAWSGGSAVASSTVGARATVTFTGTTVTLIGFRSPRTGIARVYLDGVFHATVDTYSATDIQAPIFTDTNLAPGTHEMIVEVTGLKHALATDHTLVVDAFDVRARFEEPDSSVVYTGTWAADMNEAFSGTSANYGSGSAVKSAAAGARATFTFTGTGVSWIGFRGPATGIARVYLDGAFVAEVDTFAATKAVQAALFSATALAAGSHTLAIEATGLKNAASSSAVIVVDAFDVTLPSPAPVVRRFQQPDATYTPDAWQQSGTNQLYTGGTMAFSSTAGAGADFVFTGTSVRWVGQRIFDGGIARVYLDGVLIADVDTWAPLQEEFQAAMFVATGLSPGSHTLRIEVTGTKNPSSPATRIVVDAFDVIQ
jgi:hypothetical protein